MLLGIKWCLISDQRGKLGFLFSPLQSVLYFMANCQSSCGMEPKCILTSVPNKQNKNNKHLHIYKDRMPTSTLKLKSQRQISFHLRALSASWAAWTIQTRSSLPHANTQTFEWQNFGIKFTIYFEKIFNQGIDIIVYAYTNVYLSDMCLI